MSTETVRGAGPDRAETTDLSRREALRRVTALLGGIALAGGNGLLTACRDDRARDAARAAGAGAFTPDDIAFLDEVAETILPETKTPGAKAAKVGAFMALMVTDTYAEREQKIFRDGMGSLDEACRSANRISFMAATPQQRLALLEALDREQKTYMDTRAAGAPAHYFRLMKELALLGYFTSEIGCTQALRYVESPGRFDPCVPYAPGETAWANHA
jgi:hypothetical protein